MGILVDVKVHVVNNDKPLQPPVMFDHFCNDTFFFIALIYP